MLRLYDPFYNVGVSWAEAATNDLYPYHRLEPFSYKIIYQTDLKKGIDKTVSCEIKIVNYHLQ